MIFPPLRLLRPFEWSGVEVSDGFLLVSIGGGESPRTHELEPGSRIRFWSNSDYNPEPFPLYEVVSGAIIRMYPWGEGEHYRSLYLVRRAPDEQDLAWDFVDGEWLDDDGQWLPDGAQDPTLLVGSLERTPTTEAAWEEIREESKRLRAQVSPAFRNQLPAIPIPWPGGDSWSWINIRVPQEGRIHAGASHLADSGSFFGYNYGQWVIEEGEGIVLSRTNYGISPSPVWAARLGEEGSFVISFGTHGSAVKDPQGNWRWVLSQSE